MPDTDVRRRRRPRSPSFRHRHRTLTPPAFTLIELLVVIAVIGVLAALIFPVVGAVKKHQYINNTQAEMEQLETAIDRYKAVYGFYPPAIRPIRLTNQLYFELVGTVNQPNNTTYTTLDGSARINASDVPPPFRRGRLCELHQARRGRRLAGGQEFSPGLEAESNGNQSPSAGGS